MSESSLASHTLSVLWLSLLVLVVLAGWFDYLLYPDLLEPQRCQQVEVVDRFVDFSQSMQSWTWSRYTPRYALYHFIERKEDSIV